MDCNKMELKGLYRTMKENHVPYFTDGTGRDRYIAYNNGGFFGNRGYSMDPKNTRKTGTTFFTSIGYKTGTKYYKAPNFHYHSDGNGRDRYIVINGGGLFTDSKPLGSYTLTDYLRSDESYATRNTKVNGKMCLSLGELKYLNYLRKMQKEVVNRLYTKEKKKFMKKKMNITDYGNDEKAEDYFKTLSTEPKPLTTQSSLKNILPAVKPKIVKGSKSKNNLTHDDIYGDLNKLNKYENFKYMKKTSRNFRQPYIHIINKSPEKLV